ncbi:hypothetical protein GH714_033443 [Hevea brasiliensis]|uniref:Uncharacterized protein n=1 Tax=Hevea brasiliensis TaxID=3981 RepID=A0A6A6M2K8_HEVBR|nr:hypothetical protein GH714_033443 [Hevea brasiliensis]
MALESFAFNVAEKVLEKVTSYAYQEICFAWGLQGELKKLEDILLTVKAVLLDAEEKQASDHQLRVWLAKLEDALYDAEDVLDEFECENQRRRVLQLYGTTIKKERVMTHSFVKESDVIGRGKDKENIIRLLQDSSDGGQISIIPIIGIGGLGKTALAKLAYNDERVNNHFQLKMWVCVSENFDIRNLIEKIIKSTEDGMNYGVEKLSKMEMEQLRRFLQEIIGDKKYLLILDDVWNDDLMKWNELKELLCTGANGSKILVTTRNNTVASIMGTTPTYELKGLSNDECMDLFTRWSFKEGQANQYQNLLKIGEEIVKKCKGVPLAVKTLASLLFLKTDESYWKSIRDKYLFEDMQGLKHLRTLSIYLCKSLISLPQNFKYLTALETLNITRCKNLNLTMEEGKDDQDLARFRLQKLALVGLPKLVEFPEWLLRGSTNTLQI